jgi:hypothetical protein
MLLSLVCNSTLFRFDWLGKLMLQNSMMVAMAFLVLSSCVGCADENRGKIVGRWTMIKADRLAQRVNVAPESQENGQDKQSVSEPALVKSGEADLPMMTLEFRYSGQLVTTTKLGKINSEKNGRWRMIEFDPPSTMTIEYDLDQQSDQLEVTWIDDETIRMAPPNMSGQKMKLNFKKR